MPKHVQSSRMEMEARLDRIEEMLCAGIGPGRIESTVAKEYGITTRQARTYIGRVYQRWQTQTEADAPHRREKITRMAERFYARALSEKQFAPAVQTLNLLAKLSGVLTQPSPEHKERIAELGPPPKDPAQVLGWIERSMLAALGEVMANPAVDPEQRLRWAMELYKGIGMTQARLRAKAEGALLDGADGFLDPSDPDFAAKTRARLTEVWGFDRDGGRDGPPWLSGDGAVPGKGGHGTSGGGNGGSGCN